MKRSSSSSRLASCSHPDHVLDCERARARRQWLCESKKNLRPQSLNATLRLTHFVERNDFPSDETLHEHLETEREWMAMELEALENDGVALGWRSHRGEITYAVAVYVSLTLHKQKGAKGSGKGKISMEVSFSLSLISFHFSNLWF